MPRTVQGFVVDSTARELNARLGVDFRAMFVALARLAVDAAMHNPMVIADAIQLAGTVKGKPPSLEARTWALIRRALGLAIAQVTIEALKGEGRAPADPQGLVATLDLSLEGERVLLTRDFFDFPARLPLVERLKAPLRQWLQGLGLERPCPGWWCRRPRAEPSA